MPAASAGGGAGPGERLRLLLLTGFVFASRLPWIAVDYGADPDNYRVVNAARQIATGGHYVESRLPGYPVQEYTMALLWSGGPVASNGLTAALSAVAALFLALILKRLGVRGSLLASTAFALTPVIYVNSTCSMDYLWAAAFMLGATWFVLLQRPVMAGVLLGLGIGCRLTSGAIMVPMALFILVNDSPERRRRDVILFSATALAIGAFCFAPVWLRHGLSFLTFKEPPAYPSLVAVLARATTGVWGTVGTIAWLVTGLLLTALVRRVPVSLGESTRRRAWVLCVVVVVLYLAVYARLPLESGYLVPVVPFALIGLGLAAPERLFRIFCLLLCLAPFLDVGRSGVSLGGPLAADRTSRVAGARMARAVIDATSALGDNVLVVCGSMQPRILTLIGSTPREGQRYLYLIEDAQSLKEYTTGGHQVRFVPGADLENLAIYGIDLRSLGAQELPPLDQRPSAEVWRSRLPGLAGALNVSGDSGNYGTRSGGLFKEYVPRWLTRRSASSTYATSFEMRGGSGASIRLHS